MNSFRYFWLSVLVLSMLFLCSKKVEAQDFFRLKRPGFIELDAGLTSVLGVVWLGRSFLPLALDNDVRSVDGFSKKRMNYLDARGWQINEGTLRSINILKGSAMWVDDFTRSLLDIDGGNQPYRLIQEGSNNSGLDSNHVSDILSDGEKTLRSESERQLMVKVIPEWHQTWDFRFVMIMTCLLSLYGLYCWRLRSYREKEIELEMEIKDRTEDLAESVRDLKSIQAQLVLSEKQASLGRLVNDVAHEINTPLGTAKMAFSEVQENALELMRASDGGQYENIQITARRKKIERSSSVLEKNFYRLSKLVDGFMLLSVDEPDWLRGSFFIDEWLEDVPTELGDGLLGRDIQLEFIVAEGLQVHSSPTLLKHIVLELIKNALEHGFSGEDDIDGRICVRANIKEDSFTPVLVLRVEDNGSGISEDLLPTIFDPFTAAKPSNLGLGLHVALSLLRNVLHGDISCANIPSLGCCFTVSVPLRSLAMSWVDRDQDSDLGHREAVDTAFH